VHATLDRLGLHRANAQGNFGSSIPAGLCSGSRIVCSPRA
jgi:hypothetical protein